MAAQGRFSRPSPKSKLGILVPARWNQKFQLLQADQPSKKLASSVPFIILPGHKLALADGAAPPPCAPKAQALLLCNARIKVAAPGGLAPHPSVSETDVPTTNTREL